MKIKKNNLSDWDIDSSWTLFLDRDGVINAKLDGYVTRWKDFSFLTKVPESIARLNKYFNRIIIVTNQQGIDKELMTHDDLYKVHQKMIEVIEFFGGHIDEIYYEPSLAVYDSFRRKPNPGMLIEAAQEYPDIDLQKSIFIGDSLTDIQAGHKVKMKTIWLENKLPSKVIEEIQSKCDFTIGGLADFCSLINEQNN